MKLRTNAPFIPQELEVTADVQLKDASVRQEAGIRLTISWVTHNGEEWGIVHFISEESLAG